MLINIAEINANLNGVKKGEVTSVAIMVEALGKKALNGSEIYKYSDSLKGNKTANTNRTTINTFKRRFRSSKR